ncbi:MAG: class I SAM-dependent methyltransferase [Desulfobulbaceae bacterium]|nr:class I SAM-dependent methyltransferase [Desulfobulbaceae bacterium]
MVQKSPNAGVSLFDQAAATWDTPLRAELAKGVAGTILHRLPLTAAMAAMEFGCGTGLVTALLAPHLGRMVATDSSSGMLTALDEKITGLGLANVTTRCLDLTSEPLPDERFQLIVSSMTLHHIADLPPLLRTLHGLLTTGGHIALADLDCEDGTFHSDHTGVAHLGLDRHELVAMAQEAGFSELAVTTAHTIHKEGNDGREHDYPIFLLTGRRGE